ncbi:MAG: hypothetical protein CME64_04055 [Halobacteriovoraceae bacterium]|nr:hypothetical protein [Halobacteriovoraceae bacterium]|tara:strand:- start:88472 stop:88762 length:291 start_codon:yes stop_codon:yes gene_type:complete
MKSKKYNSVKEIAKDLGLDPKLGELAVLKAELTLEIQNTIQKKGLTHKEVSELSGVPRSSVTGILNGSLQKVTLDRLIRILISMGKSLSIKVKDAA